MPLLRANSRMCDARQRKRIAFTCAMSGVTWTTFNRLEASLNSHSLNKSTWYSLTQHVWQTIEAVNHAKAAGVPHHPFQRWKKWAPTTSVITSARFQAGVTA